MAELDTVETDRGTVLRGPLVLPAREEPGSWIVATRLPAWPIDRWEKRIETGPLSVVSPDGKRVGNPLDGSWFLHPAAVVDAAGRLHLLWGEPAERPRGDSVSLRRYQQLAAHTVWHSTFDPGSGWSRAREVFRFERESSRITSQGGWHSHTRLLADSADGLHVAFNREMGRTTLLQARGGRWWARELPIGFAGYLDLTLAGAGEMYLAYTGAKARRTGPMHDLLLIRSADGGERWSAPLPVSELGKLRAYEPRVLAARGGEVHLVWRQELSTRANRVAVRHASSEDGGRSWSSPHDLTVESEGTVDLALRAVLDRCGAVHVAYQSPRDVSYARFSGEWSSGGGGLSKTRTRDVALAARPDGEIELLWSNYFPSSPGDTLVRFDAMRSSIRPSTRLPGAGSR